jgi:hypothetical protein
MERAGVPSVGSAPRGPARFNQQRRVRLSMHEANPLGPTRFRQPRQLCLHRVVVARVLFSLRLDIA